MTALSYQQIIGINLNGQQLVHSTIGQNATKLLEKDALDEDLDMKKIFTHCFYIK